VNAPIQRSREDEGIAVLVAPDDRGPHRLSGSLEVAALDAQPRQDRRSESEHVRACADLDERDGLLQLSEGSLGLIQP
jgi:hypothetical protein